MSIPRSIRALRMLQLLATLVPALATAQAALPLEEALRKAESASPMLAAQRAAADAFALAAPAAGENPDPKLVFGVDNVPAEGGDKWSLTADSMTMRRVGVMQDFVRSAKRDLRQARAEAESRREEALLEVQRADLRREVATAWFERHYALRSHALARELLEEARTQAKTAAAAFAAGTSTSPEAVGARALEAGLENRLLDFERQSRRAAAALSRWIGGDAERPPGNAPDVFSLGHAASTLHGDLSAHPHISMYVPMEAAAEAELGLARAATQPDWSVELTYGQRGSAYAGMVSLMVRMELPIFAAKRQDPIAASKARQRDQVRALAEEALRRHAAEIRASLADWEASRTRVERYRRDIVPLAEQRVQAAGAAYQGARSGLAPVFEARRSVIEEKLAAIAAEAEVARAWAQLAYLVPERRLP
jgi:outer membrane protein TolC